MNKDGKLTLLFYADAGFIGGTDHDDVQKALNIRKNWIDDYGRTQTSTQQHIKRSLQKNDIGGRIDL